MAKIGDHSVPPDFKYGEVLEKGMPEHDEYFYMKHPHMPNGKRAKIFAPFSALRGFEEEVDSKKVLYEKKRELDADAYYELNDCLVRLDDLTKTGRLARQNRVRAAVEYYVPCRDEHHEAYGIKGRYVSIEGVVRKVDRYGQRLIVDEETICFSDIYRIEILS